MKILLITNQLGVGGIEKNIVRLTKEFHRRGVEVVTCSAGGVLVDEVVAEGGKHTTISFSKDPRRLFGSVRELAGLLVSGRFDVCHVFSATAAVLMVLARLYLTATGRKRICPPVVSTIMGLMNSPTESRLLTRTRALLTVLGSRHLIVVSPAIDEIVKELPVRKRSTSHMSVVGVEVPDALPTDREISEARLRLSLKTGEQAVVTIGRLDPTKNHDLFIAAAEIVLDEIPSARFFIVGEGPMRPSLQARIDAGVWADRIELLGERHDITEILTACDLCVRPGIVEGFVGITVLEAQAIARPVVSFATEDVKLAIEDGLTGRLVENGNVQGLAQAIHDLLTDPVEAEKLGRNGRAAVTQRFSIVAIVDGLEALYLDLSRNRRGGSSTLSHPA